MKKINFKNFKQSNLEKLSKDDLKNVFGGRADTPLTEGCVNTTLCTSGCSTNKICDYCCYA